MKRVLGMVVAVWVTGLWATTQSPDKVLYEGKEYGVSVNPLEPYFKEHPKKRPTNTRYDAEGRASVVVSSGLSRGYVATFEIRDDALFVRDIAVLVGWDKARGEDNFESVMGKVFPDGAEVKADWVTGVLATTGRRDVRGTWTREDRMVFEFREGELVSKRSMAAREYGEFVRTDGYKAIRDRMKEEGYANIHYWGDPDNWEDMRGGVDDWLEGANTEGDGKIKTTEDTEGNRE
ncbi:MAG: hypothetical protein FWF84_00535 [Kiritimatiellaeota bacterium]|nr:hypothetical protein [Kiritimatiellota bacterium]